MKANESADSTGEQRSVAPAFPTTELFGMPFIDAEEIDVANHLARWAPQETRSDLDAPTASSTRPMMITPNVDIVVQLHQRGEQQLLESVRESRFVLPDGWPIVSVSRLAGRPLRQRIAGSSVFAHWWPQVAANRRRVAMMLSSQAVADGLVAEHPDAVVFVAPMIGSDAGAIGDVADDFVKLAVAAEAEFLVYGLGHPKDPLLALAVMDRWPAGLDLPLSLCLGASAELYLGLRKRAPQWAQRMRLEWVVRFLQEPRRMFHRYFVRDVAFVPIAFREILRARQS